MQSWDAAAERGDTPAAAVSKEDRRKPTAHMVITSDCPGKEETQVPGAWGAFRSSGQRYEDQITPGDQFTLRRTGLRAGDRPHVYLPFLPLPRVRKW